MFNKMTKKLATKMGRTVKEAAEPIRNGVRQAANNKVDLYSRILRLGVLILLFVDGTRRVTNETNGDPGGGPSRIIINNYIGEKKVND